MHSSKCLAGIVVMAFACGGGPTVETQNDAASDVVVVTDAANADASQDATQADVITTGVASAVLWVAPSGGSATCARATSPIAYAAAITAGNVCDTWQHAYAQASCGDLVLLANGTYGAQEIDRGAAKSCGACDVWQSDASTSPPGSTAGCITFQPSASASVTMSGDIWTNATYLRIDGLHRMTVHGALAIIGRSGSKNGKSDSCDGAYGHDVIVQGTTFDGELVNAEGGLFTLEGAVSTSLVDDSFGNAIASASAGNAAHIEDCVGTTTHQVSSHTMLARSTIHDVVVPQGSIAHTECIHANFPHDHTTIIDSRFQNCAQQNISVQSQTAGVNDTTSYFVLENNYFDSPGSHATAQGYPKEQIANVIFICTSTGGTFDHLIIRNNSFYADPTSHGFGGVTYQEDAGACTWSNGVTTGNIFSGVSSCARAGNVASNLLLSASGSGCGADTAFGTTTPPYVDPATYNFDLNGSAGAALGLVPATVGFPSIDIYGKARSSPADAGGNQS